MKSEVKKVQDFFKNKSIEVQEVESRIDLYNDIARLMVNAINKNNNKGLMTSFILPVGPKGQYERFARICNQEKISCKNLLTINMDEYLNDDESLIDEKHPLSFRGFMKSNLFDVLNDEIKIKPENIFFPEPGDITSIERLIKEIGGADICFGGVGINGHIAFNEPICDGTIEAEKYKSLKTRVLDLSKETLVTSSMKYGGHLEIIPKKCITIGMYEVFMSKKIRIYLEHDWQSAALEKIVFKKPTPSFPATFIKEHEDSSVIFSKNVLNGLHV